LTTSASVLTLTSSTTYTQPFGSDGLGDTEAFGNDAGELVSIVVWQQNFSRILTVLVKSVDESTCQRHGLCMTEVKSRHTVGWNGGPHWDSRWEIERGIGDEGSVPMTVFSLFPTASTASEIIVGG
jgi:hypothetical protein